MLEASMVALEAIERPAVESSPMHDAPDRKLAYDARAAFDWEPLAQGGGWSSANVHPSLGVVNEAGQFARGCYYREKGYLK